MSEMLKINSKGIISLVLIAIILIVGYIISKKARKSDSESELIIKKDFLKLFYQITDKKSIDEYKDLKKEISNDIYLKLKDKNNVESIKYIEEEQHRIKCIKEMLENRNKYTIEQLGFIIIACILTPLIEFILNDPYDLSIIVILLVWILFIFWRFDNRGLKRDRSITLINIYDALLEEEKGKLEINDVEEKYFEIILDNKACKNKKL